MSNRDAAERSLVHLLRQAGGYAFTDSDNWQIKEVVGLIIDTAIEEVAEMIKDGDIKIPDNKAQSVEGEKP